MLSNDGIDDVVDDRQPKRGNFPVEVTLTSKATGKGFELSEAASEAIDGLHLINATVKVKACGFGNTPNNAIDYAVDSLQRLTR